MNKLSKRLLVVVRHPESLLMQFFVMIKKMGHEVCSVTDLQRVVIEAVVQDCS